MHSVKMKQAAQVISQTTIYTHSSISKLAEFLSAVVADPENFVATSNRTESIVMMIEKYAAGLSQPVQPEMVDVAADGAVVLLTGSTGNLGAQILASLLTDSRVKTVYTLNRPASGSQSMSERHLERFHAKGLDTSTLDSPRLIYLEGESSHKHLGLKTDIYDEVCSLPLAPSGLY